MSNNTHNQNIVLKEMINSSWSGMGIINHDTKFLYTNSAFSPLLGFPNDELLSTKFKDLIVDKYKDDFTQLLNNNLKDQYINNIQVACKRKNGVEIFLDVTINLMKDKKYFVIDINDITQSVSERELINKYLIQTEIDLDGHITSASQAYCRLSGYTEEELIGKPYLNNQKQQHTDDLLDKIKLDGEISKVIKTATKKGNNIWIESVIKQKHNKYGDLLGYIAVMFDITNEMSLKKNKKFLQAQIIDKEEKLTIMTETMRLVAHEWRQPLNTISLEVQNLMLKYQLDDHVKVQETIDYLNSVSNNIESLSKIINNFQKTTEISESKIETTNESIINKALMLSKIDENDILLENNFNEPFDTYSSGLSKSISHILTNAQEAIQRSENTESKITIKTSKESKNAVFKIINEGEPIPKDIIGNIFTPYFSTKEQRNGVGLSLYNCKTIIELHLKGHVEVFNVPTGVMFKITIPI